MNNPTTTAAQDDSQIHIATAAYLTLVQAAGNLDVDIADVLRDINQGIRKSLGGDATDGLDVSTVDVRAGSSNDVASGDERRAVAKLEAELIASRAEVVRLQRQRLRAFAVAALLGAAAIAGILAFGVADVVGIAR